jgi:polyhydroxyalkanoate synthase subunit PhaE
MLAFARYVEMAMSDTKSTQDWMQDWQALQGQYWSAWSDATRQVTGQVPPANTPWHEGLEQWSRMFAGSGQQSETADRLMSSAKNYVSLMQSMLAAASGKNAGAGPMQAWTDALRDGFNLPGFDASLLNNPMAAMLKGISGQGAHGFESISENLMPFLAQAKQEGMSWLNMPAFGYAREHQEHYQKMLVGFAEYQEALKHYNALILKSSQRSFGILEDKLAERSEPGRQIDSMRALYDLWVDSAEEAYAEIALSDEFRKVYGDVVNAQTRVRAQIQQEVERVGTDLGMPTRTELNSVHKRLHELRRKFHDLDAPDATAQIEALRAEVRQLKQALARGQGQQAASAPSPKSAPKTPVARAAKAAPVRKRAAAVAKPKSVSKEGGTTFSDAISSMRNTVADQLAHEKPDVSVEQAIPSKRERRGDA